MMQKELERSTKWGSIYKRNNVKNIKYETSKHWWPELLYAILMFLVLFLLYLFPQLMDAPNSFCIMFLILYSCFLPIQIFFTIFYHVTVCQFSICQTYPSRLYISFPWALPWLSCTNKLSLMNYTVYESTFLWTM